MQISALWRAPYVTRWCQSIPAYSLSTDRPFNTPQFGAGAVMEAGREAAPVFSYVKSRGLYAGVSILGQVFVGKQ